MKQQNNIPSAAMSKTPTLDLSGYYGAGGAGAGTFGADKKAVNAQNNKASLNVGSPSGNPGFSHVGGSGGGLIWVGEGQATQADKDQFANWSNAQNGGNMTGNFQTQTLQNHYQNEMDRYGPGMKYSDSFMKVANGTDNYLGQSYQNSRGTDNRSQAPASLDLSSYYGKGGAGEGTFAADKAAVNEQNLKSQEPVNTRNLKSQGQAAPYNPGQSQQSPNYAGSSYAGYAPPKSDPRPSMSVGEPPMPSRPPANNQNNSWSYQARNSFDQAMTSPVDLGERFVADQEMYDSFSDTAYSNATRTLDPYFDRMQKDFEQKAVNRGLSPGTEAYNTAFDQAMRQENDAYNQAAFGAMQYGANRLDADRNYSETARQFDVNALEASKQFNSGLGLSYDQLDESARQHDLGLDLNYDNLDESARQHDLGLGLNYDQLDESARQFNVDTQESSNQFNLGLGLNYDKLDESARQYDLGYAESNRRYDQGYDEDNRRWDQQFGLTELGAMEDIANSYRDDNYRDAVFNNNMDQQQLNNLLQMMGLAPGSNFSPVNTAPGFDNALAADTLKYQQDLALSEAIGNGIGDIASSIDWKREPTPDATVSSNSASSQTTQRIS